MLKSNNMSKLKEILFELHTRQQGYFFGGPQDNWCNPLIETEKASKQIGGCKKYHQCNLIKDSVKYKSFQELTKSEISELVSIGCYRATNAYLSNQNSSSLILDNTTFHWDKNAISARNQNNGIWYSNPFGIRNTRIGNVIVENHELLMHHRDINPCPIGGCVTPEMQQTIIISNSENKSWAKMIACPFFYRATSENRNKYEKNLFRFAQCYISLNKVREYLIDNDFIVGAPLYRTIDFDSEIEMISEKHWYSFYSGYSFIQLIAEKSQDRGWSKFPFELRWLITVLSRSDINYKSDYRHTTSKIFLKSEVGDGLIEKYREQRFLDVCDGYATWLLLTWIVVQRYKSNNFKFEEKRLNWIYVENAQRVILTKLESLGYNLNDFFQLSKNEKGNWFRNSSFIEDLGLLGLISRDNNPSERFDYFIAWLNKHETEHDKDIIDILIPLKQIFKQSYTKNEPFKFIYEYIKSLTKNEINRIDSVFGNFSTLNPIVHLLVRAYVTKPIRWVFFPKNIETISYRSDKHEIISSGIIILLFDKLASKAYNTKIHDDNNEVLASLKKIYPLISQITSYEEQNLREEINEQKRTYLQKSIKEGLRASVANIINRNTAHHLISHVSPRTKFDEVLKRLGFNSARSLLDSNSINNNFYDFDSIIEMQNRYLSYVNDREEYVAGLNNNNQPISIHFYKDIILPLLENSLFIDNIASSEGISFPNETFENEVVSSSGVSKLRLRVFYHKDFSMQNNFTYKFCKNNVPHNGCINNCPPKTSKYELSFEELELNEFNEITAYYSDVKYIDNGVIKSKNCCVNELPYFKKLNDNGTFYSKKELYSSIDDIPILVRGTQGAHIIYSVLENFIRNTVKHAKRELLLVLDKVDIILKLSPAKESNDILFELTTNVPTFSSVDEGPKNEKGIGSIQSDFSKLIDASKKNIDETTTALGVADMRISSNFLNFGKITQANLRSYLHVGHYSKKNENDCFTTENLDGKLAHSISYSFNLKLPQNIAFIGFTHDEEIILQCFHSKGISFYSSFDEKLSQYSFNVFSSRFIDENFASFSKNWIFKVSRKSIMVGQSQLVELSFPNRFKTVKSLPIIKELNDSLLFDDMDKLLFWCWDIWIEKWTGDNKKVFLSVLPDEDPDKNIFNNLLTAKFTDNYSDINIDFSRHSSNLAANFENEALYNDPSWFHEAIEKNNNDFDFLWSLFQKNDLHYLCKNFFHYDIAETGLLKILVLDERISELSNYSHFNYPPNALKFHGFSADKNDFFKKQVELTFIEAATAANFYIATSINNSPIKGINYPLNYSFNYDNNSISLISNNPADVAKSKNLEEGYVNLLDSLEFDVLIIHRTYLEEIIKYSAVLFNHLKKIFPMIYVSTGGGNIDEVENLGNTKFNLIAFHSLKRYLNRIVMKHSFKNILT